MSENGVASLERAFCGECRERMLRAQAIVEKGVANLTVEDWNQLYQDFDSLYGAARAVNLPDMEDLARAMASYMRFLKRRSFQGLGGPPGALLQRTITLTTRCAGAWNDCMQHAQVDELRSLVAELRAAVRKPAAG